MPEKIRALSAEVLTGHCMASIPTGLTDLLGPPDVHAPIRMPEDAEKPSLQLRWETPEGWVLHIEMGFVRFVDHHRTHPVYYEGPWSNHLAFYVDGSQLKSEGCRWANDALQDALWTIENKRCNPANWPEWFPEKEKA